MSCLEVRNDGRTTIFTLNRPEKLNAINGELARELQDHFAEFDRSEQRVAIITGAGEKSFSVGADFTDLPELWRCIPTIGITTEKPVICAVHGWCIGGAMVIVALADLCVASEDCRFSYPEGKLGLTGGLVASLAARIPHKSAMEIMLLGKEISGRRAYEMGLVNRVVPNGTHLEEALAMARQLEAMAPLVIKTLKRFVVDYTLSRSPSEQMALTQRDIALVNDSNDARHGVVAAQSRTSVDFKGH